MFLMRALLLLLCAIAAAQQPDFRAGVAEVRVDVQVLVSGKPVSGLTQEDFTVSDEGLPQQVSFFGRESEPLQIVLALDVSGSMRRVLAEMSATARQALALLAPQDQVALLIFARRSEVTLEFSTDRRAIEQLLRTAPEDRQRLGAGTSVYDALLAAARQFEAAGPFAGRRAIVVLTDNGGLNEQVTDAQVLHAAAQVNAVINAIVPPGAQPPSAPAPGVYHNPDLTPTDVIRLARESGGSLLHAGKPRESLAEMFASLRLRYTLAYPLPKAEPGSYRRIRVDLAPATRRRYSKAEVRARAGYVVPGQ
jgi:Ca-activated chloride channel family protein